MVLGAVISWLGLCPIVKRIWTPSWALYSGGWCLLLLALFYAVIDVAGFKGWSFPLVVIGLNSIAAYCIAHLFEDFVGRSLDTHLGTGVFQAFGAAGQPLLRGAATLLVFWLILLWMYRRKFFLRI